jgi:DNA-binding GntR family transcriptional regulator
MSRQSAIPSSSLNPRGTLAEEAYLRIREEILRGRLLIGTPVSRRSLAKAMDMSMLPVAEALQRLEREGLVESRPRVGTRVRVPTPRFVRDSYIVREALESQAARLFAEKASPSERAELRRMAEEVDRLFDVSESKRSNRDLAFRAHAYHCAFHLRVAECTGCEMLRDAIEENQVLIFNWLRDVMARHQRRPPQFHHTLAETLCTGTPDEAMAAMRGHIGFRLEDIIELVQPQLTREWRTAAIAEAQPPAPRARTTRKTRSAK